jgi:hypothetical protein
MKSSKRRASRPVPAVAQPPQPPAAAPSLPALVAGAFTRLRLSHRVRVLRRLLMPVGPMALAVVGGGVFAKYVAQARWSQISVTLEDAASVTFNQVFELVRYVEQSDPQVLLQVVDILSDTTTMAAVGAAITALVFQHVSRRKAVRARPT